MAILGVVADDLTGANTAAALLANSQFKALTTVDHEHIDNFNFDEYDAVVINAASRTLDDDVAYNRIKDTTEILWDKGIRLFSKRIDSTIRGNLGAETEGMLAGLSEDYIAFVVAAFPTSGRAVVGGYQTVKGVPVNKTLAGADPIKPVLSSLVSEEFKRQTNLSIGNIYIDTVADGVTAIKESIEKSIAEKNRILIFDAISLKNISDIAEAIVSIKTPYIVVDPGPLTQRICELEAKHKIEVKDTNASGKYLIVAGSASDLTNTQITYLRNHSDAQVIVIDIRPFIESDDEHPVEDTIAKRMNILSQISNIVGIKAAGYTDMLIDIEAEAQKRGVTSDCITNRITHALARIVYKALKKSTNIKFDGLYLTGGDMTVAFCQEANIEALELYGEIQPHISFGQFVGGIADKIPFVTKGGMIGDADTIIQCLDYMRNMRKPS